MKKKVKFYDSRSGYNLVANIYDKNEKYLNSFEQYHVLNILKGLPAKKVIDIGAGTGRLSIKMSDMGFEVTALDISESMIKALRKKKSEINTIISDCEFMPLLANEFDLAVSAFHIVHLNNLNYFFKEVYRILKPQAWFLLTNINQKKAPAIKTEKGHIKIFSFYHSQTEVREVLLETGLIVKQEEIIKQDDTWITQIILAQKV